MIGAEDSHPLPLKGGSLRFTDEDGLVWTVTERDAGGVPGSRGPRCLVFSSQEAVRRVWEYPIGWRDLLTPALIALSWSR